jgi:RNA polymerase sigma factor (TIGR02999 family)
MSLTRRLNLMRQGDAHAANEAYEEAYQELRGIARRLVSHEFGEQVVATELVHETYVRQLRRGTVAVENRQEFFAIASRAMQHVLIDLARERKAQRRGKGAAHLPLEEARDTWAVASTPEEMISLDKHLKELKKLDPRAEKVFGLRYFLGCTAAEVEALLSRDAGELRADWEFAKAWLRDRVVQDSIHAAKRSPK